MIYAIQLFIFLTFFDQITKYIARNNLIEAEGNMLIPHVLKFDLVYNEGAAYGILPGKQIYFFIITIIAVTIFSVLITFSNFKNKKIYSISIALILSGTVGNAIDRIIFGKVTDFINFPFLSKLGKIGEFTCNIADILLIFGMILLFIDIIFLMSRRQAKVNKIEEDNQDIYTESNDLDIDNDGN